MTRYLLLLPLLLTACDRSDQEVEKCAVLTDFDTPSAEAWAGLQRCLIARYDWDANKAAFAALDFSAARRAELATDSLRTDSTAH